MRLFLHEFTETDSVLQFSKDANWLQSVISEIDEKTELDRLRPVPALRPTEAEFRFRRNDRTYFLSGRIDTQIQLLCSRCGKIVKYPCQPKFELLFTQSEQVQEMLGVSKNEEDSGDPDVVFIDRDYIELGEIAREQILLLLPFHPLCDEACKGLCSQCGADLNTERCLCAQIQAPPDAPKPLALALGRHLKEKPRK